MSTLIPYYDYIDNDLVVRLDGANRNPNADFIETGILKTIYYPTGGRTNFEYEPNTYYKSDGKNISEVTYDVAALGTTEKTFTISEKSFVKVEYNFKNNSSPYEYSDTQIYPKVLATDVSLERQGGAVGKIRFLPSKTLSGPNNLEYFSRQTKTSIAVLLDPGTYKIKTNNGGFIYFDLSLKATVQNKYTSVNQIGAGLRIKSIKNIDGTGNLQEKLFSYNITDGNSSGKIMSPLFNFYNATSYMEGYMSDPPSLPYFADMESAFINSLKTPIYKRNQPIANFIEASGSSFLPLGNSAAGQSIGYSQVTVSNVNAVPFSFQKNIGKSVYRYNNFPDVLFGTFVPYVKKDRQYDENGQLINEYHYDSTDNLLSEKEYTYNLGESFNIPGLRIMRSSSPYCFINPFGANNGSMSPPCDEMVKGVIFDRFYEEKINWWYPNKIIEKNYPSVGGTPVITTKNFSYDNTNHKQITKEETIFPDGSTAKKTYQYADEMDNQLMKSKNMIGIPLVSSTQKTIDGTTKTLQKVETYFPKTSAETSSTNGLLLPLSTKIYALDNLASPNNFVTYDKYDSNGNILQYSEKGISPVSFIWGYNKTLPIIKIEGMGYDVLMGISGISTLVDDLIAKSNQDTDVNSENLLIQKLDAFRNNSNLSNYQITTYTYKPLIGITSVTPPSGIREMYVYDDNNRLKQVVDMNGNILKENKYNYSNIMVDNPTILNIVGPNIIGNTNATATYTFTMPNMPTDLHYYWSINPSVGASYPMPYDSPTVSTTFTNSGVYTIKLVAYKASSGQSISVSKIINVNMSSPSPPYNGSTLNAIDPTVFQTSGLYLNGNSVSGYFVFRPGIFTGTKDIALIPSDKIPLTDRTVNYSEINSAVGINRQWTFTFKTTGVLSASYNGTPLTGTTDITINSFQYQKQ
ncbi:hypothetical protein SAMN05421856_105253 [Chryseobacterium taichungense]|uniref:PKD domain-containing protein n=1 Tax=Chryseobacterium taichungense TaxID=295069 RepID=A0A1H8AC64_9FLAO|nr:PKD domain-containing protein [Chryseobacterium taichungense]SEM68181.1 hypothetical protein SAMN05421856_105253 [Chryseobacterium taichungense]